jgi:hypothetical protein
MYVGTQVYPVISTGWRQVSVALVAATLPMARLLQIPRHEDIRAVDDHEAAGDDHAAVGKDGRSVPAKGLPPLLAIGNFWEHFSPLLASTQPIVSGVANGKHGKDIHFGRNAEEWLDLVETAEAHPV